ncbi:hypothetical protein Tco_1001846 [Tanacetum coccineum]
MARTPFECVDDSWKLGDECGELEVYHCKVERCLRVRLGKGDKEEKGYNNDSLVDADESSDDESNESDYQDENPIPDPYISDSEKGNKSHNTECNNNTDKPENFKIMHSDVKEQPGKGICKVDKFKVVKYSIGDDEEFMGIRTLERDSWAQTVNGVSSIYLDIFRKKDEGWVVDRTK